MCDEVGGSKACMAAPAKCGVCSSGAQHAHGWLLICRRHRRSETHISEKKIWGFLLQASDRRRPFEGAGWEVQAIAAHAAVQV